MSFFNKVKNSTYSPEYYRELMTQPFSYSLKYFFLLTLVFMVLFTLRFSVLYLPEINKTLGSVGATIIDRYPQELEVNVKDGIVSTNVEEPYYIKIPDAQKADFGGSESDIENFIVIDTKNEPSIDSLDKYKTFVLVTKNYIVAKEDNGKITMNSLKEMPDISINKNSVIQFTEKYSPYLKFLIPILILFVFIGSFFLVAFELVYLLIAALFIWLIASVKGAGIGYKKSYQLGIHLITLPLLITVIFQIGFLLFTTAVLILAAVNIIKKKEVITI